MEGIRTGTLMAWAMAISRRPARLRTLKIRLKPNDLASPSVDVTMEVTAAKEPHLESLTPMVEIRQGKIMVAGLTTAEVTGTTLIIVVMVIQDLREAETLDRLLRKSVTRPLLRTQLEIRLTMQALLNNTFSRCKQMSKVIAVMTLVQLRWTTTPTTRTTMDITIKATVQAWNNTMPSSMLPTTRPKEQPGATKLSARTSSNSNTTITTSSSSTMLATTTEPQVE